MISLPLASGAVLLAVSRIAVHADVSVTARVHAHLINDQLDAVLNRMDAGREAAMFSPEQPAEKEGAAADVLRKFSPTEASSGP